MEQSIIEFIKENLIFIGIGIAIIIAVYYLLIRPYLLAMRENKLNNTLNAEDHDATEDDEDEEETKDRFFKIPYYQMPDDWGDAFEIIVDRETKVQYLCNNDYGMTHLVDSEGKPILYKGKFEDEEELE